VSRFVYIGIDPSLTYTGVASVTQYGEIGSAGFKTSKMESDDVGELRRLKSAYQHLWTFIENASHYGKYSSIVGIEVPMGSHFGGASKVDRLFGYFVGRMSEEYFGPISITSFTPSQIKKFFTGHGNANKELMVWFANNVLDFPCTSHDIADAFAIAMLVKYIDEELYELWLAI